ncbi:MAG TPA: gliding motility protein GldN [Chitinophagaceae bacterium]|nr:gliding motility protein GldN [Chitinophagaceae bacterium]
MKKKFVFRGSLSLIFSACIAQVLCAQATDYFGNPIKDTSKSANKPATQNAAIKPDTTRKPNQNLNVPYIYVPAAGNPLTERFAPSLRSEDAIDNLSIKDKLPIDYENIREDDAVFRAKVWRVIDTREKLNSVFRNPSVYNANSELFLSILYNAIADSVSDNPITAFKDERFSEPFARDEFMKKFAGGVDTFPVVDLDNNIIRYEIRPKSFPVDSVYQFQIKEEWIFDKESSRLFVRIVGIAPMMKTYLSNGEAVSDQAYPMFWVYYPDIRPVLSKRLVYNGKNLGARMSWDDLFQSRMFGSFIVKSSFDNPYDLPLSAVYPNNTLFRLLEGDRIRDKIFNYEQSLWAY